VGINQEINTTSIDEPLQYQESILNSQHLSFGSN